MQSSLSKLNGFQVSTQHWTWESFQAQILLWLSTNLTNDRKTKDFGDGGQVTPGNNGRHTCCSTSVLVQCKPYRDWHHLPNIHLLLYSCFNASTICTANQALNLIYNTAVTWFCCVILYAQCSTVSSALIHTTHRAHSDHGTHARHSTSALASTHTAQRTATIITMANY